MRAGFNLPIGTTAALMMSGLSKQREGYAKRLDFTCEMAKRGTPQLAGTFPTADVLATNTPNFTANDCTIGRLGGDDVNAGRVSFRWDPATSVRLTLNADYIRDMSENTADHVVDIDPTRVSNNLKSELAYFGLVMDQRFNTGTSVLDVRDVFGPNPGGHGDSRQPLLQRHDRERQADPRRL